MTDAAAWDGWSEAVGSGAFRRRCPVAGCWQELTVVLDRWAEGEPPHEQVSTEVRVTEPCRVHPLTDAHRAELERAAVEAFEAVDPDD